MPSGARCGQNGLISFLSESWVMWLKQCHKPTMTGNGKHTTYKNGEIGMVYGIVLPTLPQNFFNHHFPLNICHKFVSVYPILRYDLTSL